MHFKLKYDSIIKAGPIKPNLHLSNTENKCIKLLD